MFRCFFDSSSGYGWPQADGLDPLIIKAKLRRIDGKRGDCGRWCASKHGRNKKYADGRQKNKGEAKK